MNLAIIRKRYSPYGGGERFIKNLSQQLINRGNAVTLISQSWNANEVGLQRIPVHARGLTRYARDKNFQKSVKEILKEKKFDLVQTHERYVGADICRLGDGLHRAWLERYKLSLPTWQYRLIDIDPFHRQLLRLECEMINHPRTHIVVNSELIKNELLHFYQPEAERISLIPNGVDTSNFSPPSDWLREKTRLQFNLKKEDFVIAVVGSGFRRKGIYELVDAMERLTNAKLLIVGKDREERHLQSKIRALNLDNRVFPLGPVMNVLPIYWAADLFALPSLYDPSSNAVLEALACGLPVITTLDVGTAIEIQKRGAGAICSKNPASIATIILEIREKIATMKTNARNLALEFSQEKIVSRWVALYTQLLNQK